MLVSGGGIYCNASSNPTITDCTITDNTASVDWGFGGGIFCFNNSNPTITGGTISGNTAKLRRRDPLPRQQHLYADRLHDHRQHRH